MTKIGAARLWSLNHRLLMSVIATVADDVGALGLDVKELFVLSEVDAHPYPAELATALGVRPSTARVRLHRARKALAADPELRALARPDEARDHTLTLEVGEGSNPA